MSKRWSTEEDQWTKYEREAWDALPVGAVRAVRIAPGLVVSIVKTGATSYGMHSRSKIRPGLLAGLPTAPRRLRGKYETKRSGDDR